MSFEFELELDDLARADLMASIGKDLQSLYAKRKASNGLTQKKVADELGVDKSRVNRCLSGHANLTLATVADMTRVMQGRVLVKIIPQEDAGKWAIHYTCSPNATTQNASSNKWLSATISAPRQAVSGTWK